MSKQLEIVEGGVRINAASLALMVLEIDRGRYRDR
jgi:hypothetical protein